MTRLVQIESGFRPESPVVLVRGYLNRGDGRERLGWIRALRQYGHCGPIFEFDWDASSRARFASNVIGFRDWRSLKARARAAGQQVLPRLLEERDWHGLTLVGASAGARIVYHALGAAGLPPGKVRHAILLGGAIKRSGSKDWDSVARSLDGTLVNVYSRRDAVLAAFYRAASRGAACGTGPIESRRANVANVDVSDLVRGGFLHLSAHSRYPRALAGRVRSALLEASPAQYVEHI